MKKLFVTALLAATLALPAAAQSLRPDQAQFRALYKELVETNTTHSSGNCTLAAQRMAAHLKTAGFADADLNVFVPPGFPLDGGLIATLHGSDPRIGSVEQHPGREVVAEGFEAVLDAGRHEQEVAGREARALVRAASG